MAGCALRHDIAAGWNRVLHTCARITRDLRQLAAGASTGLGFQRQDLAGDLHGGYSAGVCETVDCVSDLYLSSGDLVDSRSAHRAEDYGLATKRHTKENLKLVSSLCAFCAFCGYGCT